MDQVTVGWLAALTITRPEQPKDCLICSDTPPPSDDVIAATGTACLCERHEASLRERIAAGPTTVDDMLRIAFGPIFR